MTPPARPGDRPAGRLAEEWRLVPMTREYFTNKSAGQIARIAKAAFDAAPADTAGAVRNALPGLCRDPECPQCGHETQAVLVALGADTPTERTKGNETC